MISAELSRSSTIMSVVYSTKAEKKKKNKNSSQHMRIRDVSKFMMLDMMLI